MTGIEVATIATYAVTVGDIMAGIGAATAVAGAIGQGQAAAKTARYNAAVAENEATAARNMAAFEENRHRRATARLLSSQRAAFGASGVESGSGTPLAVLGESAEQAELDALAIRRAGTVQEAKLRSQAAADRLYAGAYSRAGYTGAGTSLLTGLSRVGSFGKGAKLPKTKTESHLQVAANAAYYTPDIAS